MTTAATVDVLAHRDAMLAVTAHIANDCARNNIQPTSWALSNYAPNFFHMSVQVPAVVQADVLGGAWSCRPDDGVSHHYHRHGSMDVDGRTVTVNVWAPWPTIGLPVGYRPSVVTA